MIKHLNLTKEEIIKLSTIGFFALLLSYIALTVSDYLENGRYQAVVVPYESGHPTVYREDKLYIVDTKTGQTKRQFN